MEARLGVSLESACPNIHESAPYFSSLIPQMGFACFLQFLDEFIHVCIHAFPLFNLHLLHSRTTDSGTRLASRPKQPPTLDFLAVEVISDRSIERV